MRTRNSVGFLEEITEAKIREKGGKLYKAYVCFCGAFGGTEISEAKAREEIREAF